MKNTVRNIYGVARKKWAEYSGRPFFAKILFRIPESAVSGQVFPADIMQGAEDAVLASLLSFSISPMIFFTA
jgi:hypothetical protein